jgi:hypothetical protein
VVEEDIMVAAVVLVDTMMEAELEHRQMVEVEVLM